MLLPTAHLGTFPLRSRSPKLEAHRRPATSIRNEKQCCKLNSFHVLHFISSVHRHFWVGLRLMYIVRESCPGMLSSSSTSSSMFLIHDFNDFSAVICSQSFAKDGSCATGWWAKCKLAWCSDEKAAMRGSLSQRFLSDFEFGTLYILYINKVSVDHA